MNTVKFLEEYVMLKVKEQFSELMHLYEIAADLEPLNSDTEFFKFIGYNGEGSLVRSFDFLKARFLNVITREIEEYRSIV